MTEIPNAQHRVTTGECSLGPADKIVWPLRFEVQQTKLYRAFHVVKPMLADSEILVLLSRDALILRAAVSSSGGARTKKRANAPTDGRPRRWCEAQVALRQPCTLPEGTSLAIMVASSLFENHLCRRELHDFGTKSDEGASVHYSFRLAAPVEVFATEAFHALKVGGEGFNHELPVRCMQTPPSLPSDPHSRPLDAGSLAATLILARPFAEGNGSHQGGRTIAVAGQQVSAMQLDCARVVRSRALAELELCIEREHAKDLAAVLAHLTGEARYWQTPDVSGFQAEGVRSGVITSPMPNRSALTISENELIAQYSIKTVNFAESMRKLLLQNATAQLVDISIGGSIVDSVVFSLAVDGGEVCVRCPAEPAATRIADKPTPGLRLRLDADRLADAAPMHGAPEIELRIYKGLIVVEQLMPTKSADRAPGAAPDEEAHRTGSVQTLIEIKHLIHYPA